MSILIKNDTYYFPQNTKYSDIASLQKSVFKETQKLDFDKTELETAQKKLGKIYSSFQTTVITPEARKTINEEISSINTKLSKIVNKENQLASMLAQLSCLSFGMIGIKSLSPVDK